MIESGKTEMPVVSRLWHQEADAKAGVMAQQIWHRSRVFRVLQGRNLLDSLLRVPAALYLWWLFRSWESVDKSSWLAAID